MPARIVLALAAVLAAGAGAAQPIATHHGPLPAARPQKCPYHHRLVLVGDCSAKKPWRCEPCPDGVMILPRVDKCGAPEERCARP